MKKLILLISLLTTINTFSQGGILTLNVYQDQRLLWVGDDKGNSSGTINALIRSEWQGNPSELGYLFVYPQFEIADLAGGTYRRYSAGAGYTFFTPVEFINATASIDYGFIDRVNYGADFSFSSSFELVFSIEDKFYISLMYQFTERSDLAGYDSTVMLGNNPVRGSGFLGFKIPLIIKK
ncbi:MAG: hypothetical protein KDH96_05205 [Candidatus Riesia sp.]|nr:hypothetical protein [Candidatus Riesia sp.]